MRKAFVIAIVALFASSCAQGRRPTPPSEADKSKLARELATTQAQILSSLPLAYPDAAIEPSNIDMKTAASINVTYWSPQFVLSIEPFYDRASEVAVLTKINFPPRGVRVNDPRKLPTTVLWTTGDKCDHLHDALVDLEQTLNRRHELLGIHPNRRRNYEEFDGGGYLARVSGFVSNDTITISGNDISPIGQWASSTLTSLEKCWRPIGGA